MNGCDVEMGVTFLEGSLLVLEVIASSVEMEIACGQDFHVLCVEKLEQVILPSLKLEMESVF